MSGVIKYIAYLTGRTELDIIFLDVFINSVEEWCNV